MIVQICSDLHLEFAENRYWLKDNPLIPKGEILIIAGDTYHLGKKYEDLDFIQKVAKDFKQVFIIPGNHEYYGGYDISSALAPSKKKILKNVFILNNCAVEIEGIRFIFSTFWSEIKKNIRAVRWGMVDFRYIKFGDENFTVDHFNDLHYYAFEFVAKEIKKEGRKVVVSHHLPSPECSVAEFKGSLLNEAFYADKTNFILDSNIDYWIYGHSHRNKSDFDLGQTKMVTNQLGYVSMQEHSSFDYGKVIEIG